MLEDFPKILHFIWLGVNPIPESFTNVLLPQWRAKHPEDEGFQIMMWGEAEVAELDFLQNREVILDQELNPALRADFLRIELLHHFGGLYADVDMTCE